MNFPLDVFEDVSRELSIVIEAVLDRHESDTTPVTLYALREAMRGGMLVSLATAGRVHPDKEESIFSEIDALIERYGEDALAVSFMRPRASENLTSVIEAAMEMRDLEYPPTLGVVRSAMHEGLLAQLIGKGDIPDDEEQTLYEEIDSLIEQHGEDALAENFVRYF